MEIGDFMEAKTSQLLRNQTYDSEGGGGGGVKSLTEHQQNWSLSGGEGFLK